MVRPLSKITRAAITFLTGLFLASGAVIGSEIAAVEHRPYVTFAPTSHDAAGPIGAAGVRLALLGDSTAAGLGVRRPENTPAGQIARLLVGRRVQWKSYGVPGARVADLALQATRMLHEGKPDITLILIGANDALHLTSLASIRENLAGVVQRLHAQGIPVVVGTCPEMGAPVFPPPLQMLVSLRGYQVANAEEEATRAAGGFPVDLAKEVGRLFGADPATLSWDEFHPSARGYRLWAQALLPAIRLALRAKDSIHSRR